MLNVFLQKGGGADVSEFLPAVLEIQETPPMPVAHWLLRTIMLFFAAAGAWAWIGMVDVVVTAAGRTVPAGRVKVIQPLETAVIRRILVAEGERAGRGQVLVELDPTQAAADLARLQGQALSLQVDRARLETLLEATRARSEAGPGGSDRSRALDAALQSRLPGKLDPWQAELAQQRMSNEWLAHQAGLQALDREIAARRAERDSAWERILQIDATIPLIAERAASMERLLARQLAPRVQWLELEQQRIERVKERDIELRRRAGLDAAVAGAEQQMSARTAAFTEKLSTELEETRGRLAAIGQEIRKAEERIARHTLTAPVSGTVQRLSVHTVGGIVTPAQELMHIVPEADRLEVEAWIMNRDIGYVREGQAAVVKFETFPFTKFGTIAGTLRGVARDAVPDDRLGPVYLARVRLSRQAMTVNGRPAPLTPGMAVTVELKLGSRRIIEFILSPFLRYRDESLRER